MRKNTAFAIAATIMGLAMIFWAKSAVVATHAEVTGCIVALCRHVQPIPANPRRRTVLLIGCSGWTFLTYCLLPRSRAERQFRAAFFDAWRRNSTAEKSFSAQSNTL